MRYLLCIIKLEDRSDRLDYVSRALTLKLDVYRLRGEYF
jgi:hypothetical protein